MPLIVSVNDRTPVHVDPVAHITRVPSRREAEAAYCRLTSNLTFEQAEAHGAEIELVRDFIWSR